MNGTLTHSEIVSRFANVLTALLVTSDSARETVSIGKAKATRPEITDNLIVNERERVNERRMKQSKTKNYRAFDQRLRASRKQDHTYSG